MVRFERYNGAYLKSARELLGESHPYFREGGLDGLVSEFLPKYRGLISAAREEGFLQDKHASVLEMMISAPTYKSVGDLIGVRGAEVKQRALSRLAGYVQRNDVRTRYDKQHLELLQQIIAGDGPRRPAKVDYKLVARYEAAIAKAEAAVAEASRSLALKARQPPEERRRLGYLAMVRGLIDIRGEIFGEGDFEGSYGSLLERAIANGFFNEREADILRKRLDGVTLEEIASQYGRTRDRIRQIESKSLRRMQSFARNPNLTGPYFGARAKSEIGKYVLQSEFFAKMAPRLEQCLSPAEGISTFEDLVRVAHEAGAIDDIVSFILSSRLNGKTSADMAHALNNMYPQGVSVYPQSVSAIEREGWATLEKYFRNRNESSKN